MIIPAIDIRNGKCVRLTQGNYNKETVLMKILLKSQKDGKATEQKKYIL